MITIWQKTTDLSDLQCILFRIIQIT